MEDIRIDSEEQPHISGIKVVKDPAEQYYINIPGQSHCSFIISAKGDLFIHGDWGYWCTAWRSFGGDFKEFLTETNFDYVAGCLVRQQMQAGGKKTISKRTEEALKTHFQELQRILKEELAVLSS